MSPESPGPPRLSWPVRFFGGVLFEAFAWYVYLPLVGLPLLFASAWVWTALDGPANPGHVAVVVVPTHLAIVAAFELRALFRAHGDSDREPPPPPPPGRLDRLIERAAENIVSRQILEVVVWLSLWLARYVFALIHGAYVLLTIATAVLIGVVAAQWGGISESAAVFVILGVFALFFLVLSRGTFEEPGAFWERLSDDTDDTLERWLARLAPPPEPP